MADVSDEERLAVAREVCGPKGCLALLPLKNGEPSSFQKVVDLVVLARRRIAELEREAKEAHEWCDEVDKERKSACARADAAEAKLRDIHEGLEPHPTEEWNALVARADAAERKLVDVLRQVRATEAPERKIFHNDSIAEKLFQDALADYARRHGIVDPRVMPATEVRCRWCRRPIEHAKQLCSTVQTQTGHSTQRDCEP